MIDRLAHPWVLWLMVPVAMGAWPLIRRGLGRSRGVAAIRFSAATRAGLGGSSWRTRLAWVPGALRTCCLMLAVLALARPQSLVAESRRSTRGIAIQVVLDRSGSMREPMVFDGLEMTRLDAVKRVLAQFVRGDGEELNGRAGDLIGLIAFARYADTVCPLVHAHDALLDLAGQTRIVTNRADDGTAIGDALALGAARLKQAEDDINRRLGREGPDARPDFVIKSKIMILLTDGVSNAGDITPEQAAAVAAEWGIRIYTIGIGAGEGYQVIRTPFGEHRIPTGAAVDEEMLRSIAEETGGRYWAADDAEALRAVYAEIDRLETTEVESLEADQARELFAIPAAAAWALLVAELVLGALVFRRAP